ncbi:LLM class flavin-dependent oxidoreductase [Jonesia quinghaiensis]|uniref:LLM class flavin-dependent oxidoreductase n=1 Tax=Jonesia quinghaiensis TaxID=262806 RepID=UPI0003FBDFE5|nr:LLM class flavin-dependent oxidoreductase [Jonesia quinghaiensis]
MPDYGRPLTVGAFITPANTDPLRPVRLAQHAEEAGLDLVTFQDHPYQPGYHDTWTLLSYIAAATSRIRLAGNVMNLPLNNPVRLARQIASLDLLTGGRVELGIGAGIFWDAIEAMGVPRLSVRDSVTGLDEAIDIIRDTWNPANRGRFVHHGTVHQVQGAKRGPAPAHDPKIWVGALKPRMQRIIGRKGDGWLPSLSYLSSLHELATGNDIIDAAAREAGREPADIERMLNINGTLTAAGKSTTGGTVFHGSPESWARDVANIAREFGVSTFILATDSEEEISVFAQVIAPMAQEMLTEAREAGDSVRWRAVAPGRRGGHFRASAAAHDAPLSEAIDYGAVPQRLRDVAFTPRDSGYDDVRSTYMAKGTPGLVLMARDVDDVRAAVEFAASHADVPLSVRSGGHGLAGQSTNTGGIVVDVSSLASVAVVNSAQRLVRAQSGALWGDVADRLAPRGWAMTSGNIGDVGVGGLATGGGLGYLARAHGMTVDHIRSARIVTADGQWVRADAQENPALLWAIRGAGSSFGIVTDVDFQALDVDKVVFAQFMLSVSDPAAFVEQWADLLARSPRELTTFVFLDRTPTSGVVAQVFAMWANDDTQAAIMVLEELLNLGEPLQQQAHLLPYSQVMAPTHQRHSGQQTIHVRNGYLTKVDSASAAAVASMLSGDTVMRVELRSVGGAINDLPAGATAFAHRDADVHVTTWFYPGDVAAHDNTWALWAAYRRGMYAGYSSDTRVDRLPDAYPGATLERLVGLKQQWDPEHLFRSGLAVPPTMPPMFEG